MSWRGGSVLLVASICLAACQVALLQGCSGARNESSDAGRQDGSAASDGAAAAGGSGPADGSGGSAADGSGDSATDGSGDSASDEAGSGDVPTDSALEDAGPAIGCDAEAENCGVSLCSAQDASVPLQVTEIIRGNWQYNPGGAYVTLPVPGYPCAAFLYDGDVRPSPTDDRWVAAPNGEFIGFSMPSTIRESGYMDVQFRYFRSLVFIPSTVTVQSFRVDAMGIDDSIHIVLYNSKYPNGVSPTDAGPSDPTVGACAGNGAATWDFKSYVQPGDVNVVLVVQADMNPMVGSLGSVEVTVNGSSPPLFACPGGGADGGGDDGGGAETTGGGGGDADASPTDATGDSGG